VSDNRQYRPFSGNSTKRLGQRAGTLYDPAAKKRLVEECEAVCVWAVQRAVGKATLISAIKQAQPVRLQVPGGHFDIWPVDEPHRLPGRRDKWSSLEDGTARLWLICTDCRRPRSKLYYFSPAGTGILSDLLCRECHGLTYLSVNSSGNKWYRETARPLRRLCRERDRLLSQRPKPSVQTRLAQLDGQIQMLRARLRPRGRRRSHLQGDAVRQKRRYRDPSLLD
jgi:hypothetical protein